jgi:hypothetical protein
LASFGLFIVGRVLWSRCQTSDNIGPKSIGNRFKIDENLVSGRSGTILGRGSRQGSSRDALRHLQRNPFGASLAEIVVQNVSFWKFRNSKMTPKLTSGGKIGAPKIALGPSARFADCPAEKVFWRSDVCADWLHAALIPCCPASLH